MKDICLHWNTLGKALYLNFTKTNLIMKKVFSICIVACAIMACNTTTNEKETGSTTANTTSDANATYAYPVSYSANFEMGDVTKAQKIAQIWKDFDDNNLKAQKDLFADSVNITFPGMEFNGTRDSMMAMTQQYRDGMASVKSSIDAIMCNKSTDKGRDGEWVSVWGNEVFAFKDGKTDSARLHEVWHFNKDGKIDYMSQFRLEYPKGK